MRNKTLLVGAVLLSLCNGASALRHSICSWQDNKKCAITFTFDDGCLNQYKVAAPLLDKYGYKATFYTITTWADGKGSPAMNWDTLRELSDAGHEIGSHTLTHPDATGASELIDSKKKIEKEIGKPCRSIAYPYCNYPTDQKALEESYISGRICSQVVMPYNTKDYYNISSVICGSQGQVNSYSSLTGWFDEAYSAGGWVVFLLHGIDSESDGYSPTKSKDLDKSLSYLNDNDKKWWVDTYANVALYLRERNAGKVKELRLTSDSLVVKVYDSLPDSIYHFPLTIKSSLPEGWTDIKVEQGGKEVKSWITGSNMYYYAVPDAGEVVITPTAVSGIERVSAEESQAKVLIEGGVVRVDPQMPVSEISLYNLSGKVVRREINAGALNLVGIPHGIYILRAICDDGTVVTRKIPLLQSDL